MLDAVLRAIKGAVKKSKPQYGGETHLGRIPKEWGKSWMRQRLGRYSKKALSEMLERFFLFCACSMSRKWPAPKGFME